MLRTTDRHPASVHCADNTPSMATRRLSSRRPVSARALRCGLRSSFLVTAPSLRLVATTRLRTTPHRKLASCRSPPGGILPPGLVMRRHPCRRRSAIYPARRLPAEDCDALPVVAPVALLPVGARRLARSSSGAASSRKRRRASCPPKTRGEHQRALWFRRLASAFRWLVVTPSV